MRFVFANSAWFGAREDQVLNGGARRHLRLPVRYGLMIHPTAGPVMIDAGYTSRAAEGRNRGLLLRLYHTTMGPEVIADGQPEPVLAQFSLTPDDVRYVVVTHFHADHVAGLSLFPNARFLVSDAAWAAVRSGWWTNFRTAVFRDLIPVDFEDRMVPLSSLAGIEAGSGLGTATDLFGDGTLLAVDLPGHAPGHIGLLMPELETPLLYAVDVQWLLQAIVEERYPGYPARLVSHNWNQQLESCRKVRNFIESGGEVALCHDPHPTSFDI